MKKKVLVILTSILAMALAGCDQGGGGEDKNKKYISELSISFVEGTTKDSTHDAVVEPNKTASLTYTYGPADATETTIYWETTSTAIASVSKGSGNTATLNAKAEGEVTLYAYALNKKNEKVSSNQLKVLVQGNYKTNADFDKASLTYNNGVEEKPLYMNTLYGGHGQPHLDSLSEQHILVIPFGFQDTELANVQTDANLDRIQKTFFGTEQEIKAAGGWQSLASFYNKSSYGKATVQGKVLPTWVKYNGTSSQFVSSHGGNAGVSAAEFARNWYIDEYKKQGHGALGADAEPLSYFDVNNDGFIDLIWVIYSHGTIQDTDWWAYKTNTGNSPATDKTKPEVQTLGWASIDWMFKNNGGYDSHTFIHETGHTFGLADYYDYNHKWSPMGGVDFMDHNMGDHCMFSKFTLGWTAPLVVDEDAIITLRPGTTTGDCFIIPSPNYNGTAFDEYMMFELMAPVGIAEQDYKNGYEGVAGYSKPGIRITHVDARVYETNRDTYLVDAPQNGKDFRIDNSCGGRVGIKIDGDYFPIMKDGKLEKSYMCLTSLMESVINEDNWTNTSTYTASNSTLFQQGQNFTLSSKRSWAETFMPSKSNLWNKAKTITGWGKNEIQEYTIDETCTFNYAVKVLEIKEDAEFGYTAKVQVTANAY